MAWWSTRTGSLVGATEIEQREGLGRRNDEVGLAAALAGQPVSVVLPRSGPESEVLYVALPIVWQERVVGAIRLAYTLQDIEATIRQINIGIAVGALATVAIAAALSAGLASAITTPIRALSHATRGLAAGELDQKLDLKTRGEVGELVEAFNQTAARLHEYEIARREFASDVSHELHALASAMQTAAQALQRGADSEPALRERLVTGLVGHTRRLGRLADDLLELARLEGGRLAIERAPVPLVGVAQQAVAEWTAEASWRHVTLDLAADGAPIVYGDHERLVQAAGNLVENALKHTPRGGSVGVRVWSDEAGHHLEVHDTGQGIPAGGAAVHLPPLLPRGRALWRRADRHGPRPRDRRSDRAGARRRGQRDQRAGRGQHVPHHAPANAARLILTLLSTGVSATMSP